MVKKAKTPKPVEPEHLFLVRSWCFDFTCGLNPEGRGSPWSDERQLRLFGEVASPGKMKLSEVLIFGQHGLVTAESRRSPTAVGSFTWVGKKPMAFLWMPADVLPIVVQMLRDGRYKSLKIKEKTSDEGHPIVSSYGFKGEHSETHLFMGD